MNARAQFYTARSLYRHGMRVAPVFIPGDPEACQSVRRWGRSIRPECQEALAMASRLNPRCAQFLPRIAAAPLVSTLRALFHHHNPRMYEWAGGGYRREVGHPYRRQALRELGTGMLLCGSPILPGPTQPLAVIRQTEIDIRLRTLDPRSKMDPVAREIFEPIFRAMGWAS